MLLASWSLLLIREVAGHDLIRTTWGVTTFDDPSQWKTYLEDLAARGYAGFEAPTWGVCGVPTGPTMGCGTHVCPEERVELFREALQSSGLYYIAQLHTCGYPIAQADLASHLESVKSLASIAKEKLNATLANVHGGIDWWSTATKVDFLRGSAVVSEELGLPMAHETHRMRALSTPWTLADIFKVLDDELGGALLETQGGRLSPFGLLNLTADLSHWVLAAVSPHLANFTTNEFVHALFMRLAVDFLHRNVPSTSLLTRTGGLLS